LNSVTAFWVSKTKDSLAILNNACPAGTKKKTRKQKRKQMEIRENKENKQTNKNNNNVINKTSPRDSKY